MPARTLKSPGPSRQSPGTASAERDRSGPAPEDRGLRPEDSTPKAPIGRRLAAACLAVVIVVGSAVLWIGLPLAGFWAAGRLTKTAESFLLFASGVVPVSMVLGGWALYRVGARYESLRPPRGERDGR